jgi:tRNA (guanine-N7-)-methyltransferase
MSKPTAAPRFDWHGRRQGRKLRLGRKRLVESFLPSITLAVPPGEQPFDPRDQFSPPPQALWLEIGFGAGEHLAGQATRHRDTGFIGCEVFLNGLASALSHIDREKLTNVRILHGDARALLPRLPVAAIQRVYLLFPDPWPKRRHRERRFTGRANLDALARVMADGAELRIASDDMGYIRWTLENARLHPDLAWLARRPLDWRQPPADWIATRYQEKAINAGLRPAYLTFQRRPRR